MNNFFKYLGITATGFLLGIVVQRCSHRTQPKQNIIYKNDTIILKPKEIVKYDTVRLTNEKIKIIKSDPVVDTVYYAQIKTIDSVAKSAATIREYREQLIDSFQTITVESNVTGILNSQRISYETNPKQKNEVEERKLFLLGGATLYNIESKNINFQVQTGLNFKSWQLYGTLDTNENLGIGINIKI